MSKPPSDKTALQTERRLIKQLRIDLERATSSCAEYRVRATKAETEAAEWKRRFDLLLDKGFKANPRAESEK